MRIFLSFLVAFTLSSSVSAQTKTLNPGAVTNSISPDRLMTVAVTKSPPKLLLVSSQSDKPLAELAVGERSIPIVVPANSTNILWRTNSDAVAVVFSNTNDSAIFVCAKLANGFKWIDISSVEGPNLGIIGRPRSDFARIEHVPARWTQGEAGPRMIWVKTHFWDKKGKRFTPQNEVAIFPNGEFGWK